MYAWRKGDELCQEEMEPDRPARDVAVAAVRAALRERAEVAWAAHSPQARGEIVYVRNAVIGSRMWSDNRVMQKCARSAVGK